MHIVPTNDLLRHYADKHCPCGPVFKDGLYVHNAYDAREYIEMGYSVITYINDKEIFCYRNSKKFKPTNQVTFNLD